MTYYKFMTNNFLGNFEHKDISNYPVYSVTEFSYSIKKIVESSFSYVKIRGEIFRPSFPSSGHVYFTLKDNDSSLSAIIWKYNLSKLKIKPEEGMDVICSGKITTFSGQSKYQIVIDTLELAGQGTLLKTLNERKIKLFEEGIFDEKHKKNLPFLPKVIGLVTSSSGAVIKDVLQTLSGRFPSHVYLWPVSVQGQGASKEIVQAINGFNEENNYNYIKKPDVIIVARGGGSLEDLWAFNEEILVRSVFKSTIPIISAIGHETDVTLIDFVSDFRASTPTQAAERVVPDIEELKAKLRELGVRLNFSILNKTNIAKDKLKSLVRLFRKPEDTFFEKSQTLDYLIRDLENNFYKIFSYQENKIKQISLDLFSPNMLINNLESKNNILKNKLKTAYEKILFKKEFSLKSLSKLLESNDFQKILKRGFTLILDNNDAPIKLSSEAKHKSEIKIKFYDKTRAAQLKN